MLTAHDLSLSYCRTVSAYWRGDSELLPKFDAWLARFWVAEGPHEPATSPVAVCAHGAGGHGIHWYDSENVVLGYVPGVRGRYRIPRTAVLPSDAGRSVDGGKANVLPHDGGPS